MNEYLNDDDAGRGCAVMVLFVLGCAAVPLVVEVLLRWLG